MRLIGISAVLATALAGLCAVAGAATLDREALTRQILDNCVYRQFEVKGLKRDKLVDNCRCATKAAMTALPGESFQQPRSGGLTGPQDRALRASIPLCFKG